jgi:hypothetical protein
VRQRTVSCLCGSFVWSIKQTAPSFHHTVCIFQPTKKGRSRREANHTG